MGPHHHPHGVPFVRDAPGGVPLLPHFARHGTHRTAAGGEEFADLPGIGLTPNSTSLELMDIYTVYITDIYIYITIMARGDIPTYGGL